MNCLESYRKKLVHDLNVNFQKIKISHEEDPVHDFRTGVKRLTAFYFFIQFTKPEIRAKEILRPYRALFKSIGIVRDLQISMGLINELNGDRRHITKLGYAVRSSYKVFVKMVEENNISRIRVPTIQSMGLGEDEILKNKIIYLKNLIIKVNTLKARMTAKAWHRKRILLKRYHHTLDAFHYCPGHEMEEEEFKQIKVLEQLLGDWHDRIITAELINDHVQQSAPFLRKLKFQERTLIEAARIYHRKYSLWNTRLFINV